MVFGLVLTPNKKYSQTVEKDYQLTNAALDLKSCGAEATQLMVTVDKNTFLLCTLSKDKPQHPLDLQLSQGDKIAFCSIGSGTIHLVGYLHPDDPMGDFGDAGDSDVSEEEDEETEVPNLVPIEGKKEKKTKAAKAEAQKDSDDDEDESDDDDFEMDDDDIEGEDSGEEEQEEDSDEDDEEESEEELEQPQKKMKTDKQQQQNGLENGVAQKKDKKQQKPETKGAKEPQQKAGKKTVLQGGVMVEELKVGDGPEAKQNKKVVVYYEGRLKSNNKVFDSCKAGNGFKFTIGRGEVIRGWEIGVAGMKMGGKRRITCPPKMAYGSKGSPPVIPPNSTLVFEVELRQIKN
ncbi:46 kDa FK506-binding nuclear protein [Phlebotomus argentipes]|uniref:46 kDa FK506-binding nuclear protein n=1 Tax=Phlebotomus argentipes TaxID=94469 RepID=UPI002892B01E|nr:46 kDa FK506-binding nuclear protein [Phlebotomus argentipes]